MADPTEPRRWADGGGPPGMEELLRTARKTKPTITEVTRVGEALGVKGSGTWTALSFSGGVAALVLAVAAGGIAARSHLASPPNERKPASTVQHHESAVAIEPEIAEESSVSLGEPATPGVKDEVASTAIVKATNRAKSAATKPSELELLRGARDEIVSRPKVALTYLARHKQLYPSGILAEEREALTISAYRALGKSSAADKQAEAFRETFPDSPHEANAKPR